MVSDLAKYGVIPNKTWKTYLPQLDMPMMPHLIRGMIDGDGWWSCKLNKNNKCVKQTVGFCGNNLIVSQLRNFLATELSLNITPKILICNNDNMFSQTQWDNKLDCVAIGEYLYKNATVYLKRKYEKFLYIVNN